jgi:hypothetical protein
MALGRYGGVIWGRLRIGLRSIGRLKEFGAGGRAILAAKEINSMLTSLLT